LSPRATHPVIAKLGIFGGSFNPIHIAHLRSAEEVAEAVGLDRVLFVPTAAPPHKAARDLAAAADRLAMVRLAVAGNPLFRASRIEVDRGGHSYTVDTMRALRTRFPGSRLYLIIGMDQYAELETWKDYAALFTLGSVVVTSRPGVSFRQGLGSLPVAVRGDFCYQNHQDRLLHTTGTEIIFLRISDIDISASAIRQRIRRGGSVRYLVSPSVHRYFQQHRLYTRRRSSLANG
jgi:nicotinate-nucleotide adenylyltransferase